MYIGLWSRVSGFERDKLTKALERRSVVEGTLMRTTIHLVSACDYWPFAVGIRRGRRAHWLRNHPRHPDAKAMAAATAKLRRGLAGGPLRTAEIDELLGKERSIGVVLWLDLVRVPPSGTWERRRADLDWLGPADVTAEPGLERLVQRYLGGFGPASRKDIAGWAGLPVGEIAPVLDRLRLRRFRAESGELLLDLPRAPLPDPDAPRPSASCPCGTRPCSCTHAGRESFPRSTARAFSVRRRHTRSTRSSSTGPWLERGSTRAAASRSSRTPASTGRLSARLVRRLSG